MKSFHKQGVRGGEVNRISYLLFRNYRAKNYLFHFVAKFAATNLNRDFINRGLGGRRFMKLFHKIQFFLNGLLP